MIEQEQDIVLFGYFVVYETVYFGKLALVHCKCGNGCRPGDAYGDHAIGNGKCAAVAASYPTAVQ